MSLNKNKSRHTIPLNSPTITTKAEVGGGTVVVARVHAWHLSRAPPPKVTSRPRQMTCCSARAPGEVRTSHVAWQENPDGGRSRQVSSLSPDVTHAHDVREILPPSLTSPTADPLKSGTSKQKTRLIYACLWLIATLQALLPLHLKPLPTHKMSSWLEEKKKGCGEVPVLLLFLLRCNKRLPQYTPLCADYVIGVGKNTDEQVSSINHLVLWEKPDLQTCHSQENLVNDLFTDGMV